MTLPFVPLIGLATLWTFRSVYDLNEVVKDEGLIAACLIWRNLGFLLGLLGHVSKLHVVIVVGSLTSFLFIAFNRSWTTPTTLKAIQKIERLGNSNLKPLLFPCRTSHTRFFPKKHSFSYSYLFVGIPVGWQGAVYSVVSADYELLRTDEPDARRGWFSVEAEDYLDRGRHPGGLRGKLHAYLESQKVKPEKYPFAYLVTAPRFLGYSFNPVSFWYLYSQEHELKAMILEVNNTFDERRMYLMECELSDETTYENGNGNQSSKTAKFTHSWPKDFHVSPFNSRKGTYALSSADPFSTSTATRPISNAVTLSSSKNHPKLLARVYSTSAAIDLESLTPLQLARFLRSWWYVGLITFPRIIVQASKLFFRRSLHVWYRPEVNPTSVGRSETREEAILERCFRAYLKRQVQMADACLTVRYIAAGRSCVREELFKSEKACKGAVELTFRVLTPAFYGRFWGGVDCLEAVERDCAGRGDGERTVSVSAPEMLGVVFGGRQEAADLMSEERLGMGDRVRWGVLGLLRRWASRRDASVVRKGLDLRTSALSPLDRFVMRTQPTNSMREYRRTVLSLAVCHLIALGEPALLRMVDWMVRGALAYTTLSAVIGACGLVENKLESSAMETVMMIGKLSSLTLWAGLKGVA